jgi:hypothetical protein
MVGPRREAGCHHLASPFFGRCGSRRGSLIPQVRLFHVA